MKYCAPGASQVVPAGELAGQLALALFHDVVERHLRRPSRCSRSCESRSAARWCSTLMNVAASACVAETDVRFGGDQIHLAETEARLHLAAFLRREVRAQVVLELLERREPLPVEVAVVRVVPVAAVRRGGRAAPPDPSGTA